MYMPMSQGGGLGGGPDNTFLWDTQLWDFLNSDNSLGGGGGGNNSATTTTTTTTGKDKVVVDLTNSNNMQTAVGVAAGKSRAGGAHKNNDTIREMNEGGGGVGDEAVATEDHEMHIWTERERRKKMRNMFSNLHALLPQLPPKADKSTIVDEAMNYIKTLQNTLQKLQKQKLERLQTATTPINVDPSPPITPQKLALDSREAFLADQGSSSSNWAITNATNNTSANLLSVPRFPTTIFETWSSPNLILNVCGEDAHLSVCCPKKSGLFLAICFVLEKHKLEVVSAQVSSDSTRNMYMIQAHATGVDQFPKAFPVEEIYKQAAGEIMFLMVP